MLDIPIKVAFNQIATHTLFRQRRSVALILMGTLKNEYVHIVQRVEGGEGR